MSNKVYKVVTSDGKFYHAGLWGASKRGKVWASKGDIKRALTARRRYNPDPQDAQVIEYELVEVARYTLEEM